MTVVAVLRACDPDTFKPALQSPAKTHQILIGLSLVVKNFSCSKEFRVPIGDEYKKTSYGQFIPFIIVPK